jgi:hypothetical protein
MQHFTTALLLGDLLTRLHAAFVVSVTAAFDETVSQRHAFSLVRSSGAGDWLAAIWDSSKRLREFKLDSELTRVGQWLMSPSENEPERSAFTTIFEELDALAAGLQLRGPRRSKKTPPRGALLDLVLQVRNKTVHGAYESSFYEDHVETVESAVRRLFSNTPLWEVRLVQVTKPTHGRLLHGARPRESIAVDGAFRSGELVLCLDRQAFALTPLIQVANGHTYLANGSWRPTRAPSSCATRWRLRSPGRERSGSHCPSSPGPRCPEWDRWSTATTGSSRSSARVRTRSSTPSSAVGGHADGR